MSRWLAFGLAAGLLLASRPAYANSVDYGGLAVLVGGCLVIAVVSFVLSLATLLIAAFVDVGADKMRGQKHWISGAGVVVGYLCLISTIGSLGFFLWLVQLASDSEKPALIAGAVAIALVPIGTAYGAIVRCRRLARYAEMPPADPP